MRAFIRSIATFWASACRIEIEKNRTAVRGTAVRSLKTSRRPSMFAPHPFSRFRPPFSKGTRDAAKTLRGTHSVVLASFYKRHLAVRQKRFAAPFLESFGQAFSKACAGEGREALLALRRGRNSPYGVSFLRTFFFAPPACKEKSGLTDFGVEPATLREGFLKI